MHSQRIKVFARHCNFSQSSINKARPAGFSREICYRNLKRTINPDLAEITFLMDGDVSKHFLKQETDYPVIPIQGGSDASSFLSMLNYIESLSLPDETIVYLLEDDFFHRPLWCELTVEVFDTLQCDYATLYDHLDKYFFKMYENLKSQIFITQTCHWRTVPSTTNTYVCRWKTLRRDLAIHKKFCRLAVNAHAKFLRLGRRGVKLVSPMPGWSTHMETEFLSPIINWDELLQEEICIHTHRSGSIQHQP